MPVVAPRAGGAPDVVRHLESGLLYDPADQRALPTRVEAVVADRHRGLLGARGRELAAARSWTDAVDELVAALSRASRRVASRPYDPRMSSASQILEREGELDAVAAALDSAADGRAGP